MTKDVDSQLHNEMSLQEILKKRGRVEKQNASQYTFLDSVLGSGSDIERVMSRPLLNTSTFSYTLGFNL